MLTSFAPLFASVSESFLALAGGVTVSRRYAREQTIALDLTGGDDSRVNTDHLSTLCLLRSPKYRHAINMALFAL